MTATSTSTKRVALLATGDEITNGDILNTNGQYIAQQLFSHGISVGMHAIAKDQQEDIEQALHFLLKTHQAVIITGGLGPTSDDRTRFALSEVIQQPLIFDPTTWEAIIARLNRYTTGKQPDSNKQQALFPQNGHILPNVNGTAAGCRVTYNNGVIFMLPGPPSECRPIFDEQALPYLLAENFARPFFYKRWLLFGVSEGKIAAELDAAISEYSCQTGYRIAYPYLEFKLFSQDASHFENACCSVQPILSPHLRGDGNRTTSESLIKKLENYPTKIYLIDNATGGLLAKTLLSPNTFSSLQFNRPLTEDKSSLQITIEGLQDYWYRRSDITHTILKIMINYNGKSKTIEHTLPNRDERTVLYATEVVCHEILQII